MALEPIHANLQLLYRNVHVNHSDDRIETWPIAVSNEIGLKTMFGGGTGASMVKNWAGAPENYASLVPTPTLDAVLGSRFQGQCCLCIIDVEGSEMRVLKDVAGARSSNPKPIWIAEVSVSEHWPTGTRVNLNLLATFQTFRDSGYEVWTADRRLRPVTRSDIESIANGGMDRLSAHNFLAVESRRKREMFEEQQAISQRTPASSGID